MTQERVDLRLAPVALTAWVGCAVAVDLPSGRVLSLAVGLVLASALVAVWTRGLRGVVATVVMLMLGVGGAALAISGLRAGAVQAGPIPELARQRAYVTMTAAVLSDPVLKTGSFADYVLVRVRVEDVVGRGQASDVRAPLLVIGEKGLADVNLGDQVRLEGRLSAAEGSDLAGVLTTGRLPELLAAAPWWMRGIDSVREGVRAAHKPLPDGPRALVPALVDGDDVGMPETLEEDFRTTGLTHLLAVSGSNLTLVLGFVMLMARWLGARGRGLLPVGMAAVLFFVLLARPEPSVLRAAAMGVVGLAGLSSGGRRRGARALAIAVTVLVLIDPWLARSPGFVLSTLATAGILLLAPGWRDALARWLPGWLAEAIAVPLAAQVMCTPVVAALSGQVSLVAVGSNLVAAPAVGPATVLGLISGLVAVVCEPLGQLGGRLAGVPAWWIVTVATQSAQLDGASAAWPAGGWAMVLLCVICVLAIALLPFVLRRVTWCVTVLAVLSLIVVRPGGRSGWPPPDWLIVMCDVGQGDAIVLRAAADAAVVVDAGPDVRAIDDCLDQLDIQRVPLVVLTHFHADHVDGLAGLLSGRTVDQIEVSPVPEPADRAREVAELADSAGVEVVIGGAGEQRTIGATSLEFLGPTRTDGVDPNNASLVIAAEVFGREILLTGDAEPEEQADVLRSAADLDTEILKVPHHGSANVDPAFLAASRPAVAIVSAGVDNDYGHPAPSLLALLEGLGVPVYRTDRDGDIAVVEDNGLAVVTQR